MTHTVESFDRILLVRRKALGDALVSLPAVAVVAAAWPAAQVDLVVDRPLAALFRDLAWNVNVISYPDDADGHWLAWLRGRRYELVIDWLGSPRTAVWCALSGARLRVGYDLPGRRWAYNLRVPRNRDRGLALRGFAGEAFLDPLRALGLQPDPWRPASPVAKAADAAPDDASPFGRWLEGWCRSGGPRVVLVMSATWSAKAWPARHIVGLHRELAAAGVHAVLAPGPGDDALLAGIAGGLPPDALAPPTTLPEMARLLRVTDLFIGTDNGLRHLAALLGVPTVTVFGPTDPAGWNPPGPRHVGVRTGQACSPCDLTACPVAGHPCLEDLEPATVAAAALALLGADRADAPGPNGRMTLC